MLSPRQKQIFNFVKEYWHKKNESPTNREIAKHFRLSSTGTIQEHLKKIEDKGLIRIHKNQPRGIEILESELMVKIPLLGTIAAGQPLTLFDVPKETIAVPKSKIPSSSEIYALRVIGDSMIDENINDGDIILVKQQATAENGQKVVALINHDEATLKKFYKERGQIRLQPANKKLEPIIIKRGMPIELRGVVVDVIKDPGSGVEFQPEKLQTKKVKKYSKLPLNKIICGDTIKIMKKIPDGSIDLIITSPPYNIKNSTGNGLKDGRGGKWANAALQKGYSHHDDCMPHKKYVKWQRNCLEEMLRVIPEHGVIFYNHKWRVQGGLLQGRQDIVSGFPVRQIIIWKRKGGINFNPGYFLPTYEVIYVIAKSKFKLVPKANACGDIWEFTQEMNNPHPAPFPVSLIDRIVSSTNAKIVFDPFMGSGTTAISAINFQRNYIGIDVSPSYCKMARERIKKHVTKAKLS